MDSISPRGTCQLSREDSVSLAELAGSIRLHGLMKPITVQRVGHGRFTVVSGNRRLMACRMLGMTHVDAVVLWPGPQTQNAQQLMDSLLSGRLHYLEQAHALQSLSTVYGCNREELARALGTTAAVVSARIHLVALDEELQIFLMEEGVPERIAQALLRLPDREARMLIARKAAAQGLSVREVEALISSAINRLPVPPMPGGRTIYRMRDHRLYLNAIRSIIAQMREAGVEVAADEHQAADRVEITLAISTRRRRSER
ncbi:MAG: ParB/RepB/Spo0J family partition protein [Christensenellaceae bacterium]|nr:ParB/RepB/Spo0J family partition protein [Christensenellaceae bacterium]